jgi:eukaryotic translation initiation factor 2C
MDNIYQINSLPGGLRHLRVRDADEIAKYSVPVETVPRPGFNPTGKEIEVQMNAFAITNFPNKTVYQYDVSTSA